MHRNAASDLGSVLALWQDVQTLAADCDGRSAAVISAAPLPKLRALSLKYTVPRGEEWSILALSRTAAAGLQELHLSNIIGCPVLDIEAIRGYAQLRTLSIEGCNISDLGPLAGCVHLEVLETCASYGSTDVSDIAPLGSCAKLKKLSIVA
ncbi:hypothetical protein FOA52_008153 [Chlamydomonas sp. UWO 241]|nr:hypothetical protein FOA52_008153 [Chlamydomonas sp. UWO 241]